MVKDEDNQIATQYNVTLHDKGKGYLREFTSAERVRYTGAGSMINQIQCP